MPSLASRKNSALPTSKKPAGASKGSCPPPTTPKAKAKECQRVDDHRLVLCDNLARVSPPTALIRLCADCDRYFVHCCRCYTASHDAVTAGGEKPRVCHHWPLVLTSSSVPCNGCDDATAGIGGELGLKSGNVWSMPVDEDLDGDQKRTNQRAELLAVIEGLKRLKKAEAKDDATDPNHASCRREWVVGLDSAYVVDTYLNLFPKWQLNKFKTASGRTPANLDLFQRLDKLIRGIETRRGVAVGFWTLPKTTYYPAQDLAKEAALAHVPGPSTCSASCPHRAPLRELPEQHIVVPASSVRLLNPEASTSVLADAKGKRKAAA